MISCYDESDHADNDRRTEHRCSRSQRCEASWSQREREIVFLVLIFVYCDRASILAFGYLHPRTASTKKKSFLHTLAHCTASVSFTWALQHSPQVHRTSRLLATSVALQVDSSLHHPSDCRRKLNATTVNLRLLRTNAALECGYQGTLRTRRSKSECTSTRRNSPP